MNLHEKEEFRDLINLVSEETGISEAIIEKDYFVTIFLRDLVQEVPDVIFKGGTSLSKCYGVVRRFSEDIDLNYSNGDRKPSVSMRRKLKDGILMAARKNGLVLKDADPAAIPYKQDFYVYHFQ